MKRLRKPFAFLFLFGYLFNLVGYPLAFDWLSHCSDVAMDQQLKVKSAKNPSLRLIKIALNLPYYTDQLQYESTSGTVVIDGNDYLLVKRRVYQDTLFLLCAKNLDKMRIQCAAREYSKILYNLYPSADKKVTAFKMATHTGADHLARHSEDAYLTRGQNGRDHKPSLYADVIGRPPADPPDIAG